LNQSNLQGRDTIKLAVLSDKRNKLDIYSQSFILMMMFLLLTTAISCAQILQKRQVLPTPHGHSFNVPTQPLLNNALNNTQLPVGQARRGRVNIPLEIQETQGAVKVDTRIQISSDSYSIVCKTCN
jgi:hypothetical protein